MKTFISLWFTVFFCTSLQAQTGKITGRIIDSETLKPLPFTNVYVNNTTIGTLTNDNGEFALKNLSVGNTDIVFSFIGYTPQKIKVTVQQADNKPILISLVADAKKVLEVVVKSSRDKAWEKQLRRFEKVFLGNTATCKLLNPWVVDFAEESGMSTATASIPLEIDNSRLGYKLFFQLKKFGYSATAFSIVGDIRFVELQTADKSLIATWKKNRERAYYGSAKHLMKSILDRQLTRQGFLLYGDRVKGTPRSRSFNFELDRNLVSYDTLSINVSPAGINTYALAIKDRMEVHYTNAFTTSGFYKDITNPVSWLEVRNGYVLVNKEGVMLNPTDVTLSGSMTEGRVSGMLPLDYQPESPVVSPSPARFLASKRLEKVYLHTDKPYYYLGDNLWFCAYMHYRIPGLMDSLSNVLYVDLINSDRVIVQNRILPIDSGRAANSFRLSAQLKPGTYWLRAYTQWMRNYGVDQLFCKPIIILPLNRIVNEAIRPPVSDSLLKVTFDKSTYQKRSGVKMTIRLDTAGITNLAGGSFSVAVFDETTTVPVAEPITIKTGFDLVEPANDRGAKFNYPIERGLTINGVYTYKKEKKVKPKLTLLPENLGTIYQPDLDKNGAFSLKGLAFYDSTTFVFQPPDGTIHIVNSDLPDLPEKLPEFALRTVPTAIPHNLYSGDTLQARILAEVKVSAARQVQPQSSYGQPDFYLKGESLERYASIAEAIAAKLPSFKLIYEQTNWFLIWARASVPTSSDIRKGSDLSSHEPNLYVDNVMVVGMSVGDRLMQLNPTLIDHIEVNGMITANQGANGSNGLINVFTKKVREVDSKGLSFVKVRGFDRERLFPSPNYDRVVPNAGSADYRSLVYWNPRVRLGAPQSPVELAFFTSDQSGYYRVVVEGVTNTGMAIRSEARFSVNE